MNERTWRQRCEGISTGTGPSCDPREARVRELMAAAYPREYPSAEPSQALAAGVAALAARHHARAARAPSRERAVPRRIFMLGAAAVALLLILGLPWGGGERSLPAVGGLSSSRARPISPTAGTPLPPSADVNHGASGHLQPQNAVVKRRAEGERSIPHRRRQRGDDLAELNRAHSLPAQWRGPSAVQTRANGEARTGDDFVYVPPPRLVSAEAGQAAVAAEMHRREAAVVDERLAREVSLRFKGTALSDLCDHLRSETGIRLEAGASVADEKVTVFCKNRPLRELMRQLSRPFGYAWLRSGRGTREAGRGEYRYELVQDLKSQLMEEELRGRDRREALLALDREMQRYRPYLGLSPDEALARAKTAPEAEKKRLEHLATDGWGAIQIYFRLSPADLTALRSGQSLTFSVDPKPGQQPLPAEIAAGVLRGLRDWRASRREGDRWEIETAQTLPDGLSLLSVPEARAEVSLRLDTKQLSQTTLMGGSGVRAGGTTMSNAENLATGTATAVGGPGDPASSTRPRKDPALKLRVSLEPRSSCAGEPARTEDAPAAGQKIEPRVTSADALEALHQATGLPIVSDYYTRLYPAASVTVRNRTLSDALNVLGDAMRQRWNQDAGWLQFRSATYYDERLKEVPNRLLDRWASSRRANGGALPLQDLLEITRLTDAQLDAESMAEGARECYGIVEWSLAQNGNLRKRAPFLLQLTPPQREEALTPAGLLFGRMTLAQQQQFLTEVLSPDEERLPTPEALAAGSLRIEYAQPGWYRWAIPDVEDRPDRPQVPLSPVRERALGAALAAARRIDPRVPEEQVVPSTLALRLQYAIGTPRTRRHTSQIVITRSGTTARGNSSDPDEEAPRPEKSP